VDTAVGTIATVVDALREQLANTTAFRTWDGASYTVDQAKARIYRQTMPLFADLDALAALRPFAVIWVPLQGVSWRAVAAPNHCRASGSLVVEFHRAPPTLDAADPGANERDYHNFVGAVVQSGDPSAPGLWELAGQAGYLTLREVRADGVYRARPEDVPTVGDCDLAYLEVDWGVT